MSTVAAGPGGTAIRVYYPPLGGERPIAIRQVRVAADIPAEERPRFEVLRSDRPAFAAFVTGRANRGGTFFNVPAGGVDLCNVNVPVRRRAG